jgi:hypothetical protein
LSESGPRHEASAASERTRLRDRRRRNILLTVGSAVAVAILGATASAVITTDRIDAVFGGGAVEKTPSPTPTPISYKTVTSLDKSLSFSVPSTWSARDGSYDVTDDQGVAVITGTQVEKSISFQHDNAYVAASVDATSIDGTVRPSSGRSAFLDAILDEGDWTKEGCILGSEPARTNGSGRSPGSPRTAPRS